MPRKNHLPKRRKNKKRIYAPDNGRKKPTYDGLQKDYEYGF